MASFEQTFINYALATLLIVSLLAFGITLENDNNSSVDITNNTLIDNSYSQLRDDLGGMSGKAQSQRELFEGETPTAGFGSLILFSIVSSGKVFTGITIGTFNILINLPMVLFGVDPIVSSVLSTILIVLILLGLWVLYKLGG